MIIIHWALVIGYSQTIYIYMFQQHFFQAVNILVPASFGIDLARHQGVRPLAKAPLFSLGAQRVQRLKDSSARCSFFRRKRCTGGRFEAHAHCHGDVRAKAGLFGLGCLGMWQRTTKRTWKLAVEGGEYDLHAKTDRCMC